MANQKNRLSEKIRIGPPSMANLYFLPPLSDHLKFIQTSHRKHMVELNQKYGSLSQGSIDNYVTGGGIRASTLWNGLGKNLFEKLDINWSDILKEYRNLIRDRKYHIRNTVEWSNVAKSMPETNLTRRFIEQRVDALVGERKRVAKGPEFDNNIATLEHLMPFYREHTGVSSENLDYFMQLAKEHELSAGLTPGIEEDKDKALAGIRFLVAMRMDFYLGLHATTSSSEVMQQHIFRMFIQEENPRKSLVEAVLVYAKDQFGYQSWSEFGKNFSSVERDYAGMGFTAKDKKSTSDEGSKSLLNKWRKSSCNCACHGDCKCGQITNEQITVFCKRVENVDIDTRQAGLVSMGGLQGLENLLFRARSFDNLLGDIRAEIKLLSKNDTCSRQEYATEQFRENLKRFDTYIEKFASSEPPARLAG